MKKAVIDIDGVLNNYPATFVNFVNDRLNTSFESLYTIKASLSYVGYRQLKEEYRQSNYKHNAEVKQHAKELLDYLHDNDFFVFIVTSRELFKNNQLERTVMWLKQNKLAYDYMYCSAKKDFTIIEKFGHVDVVVEDNADNINRIAKFNGNAAYFHVINHDNVNEHLDIGMNVESLKTIIDTLEAQK